MSAVRHLYVHLPFCAHRCGYCDFVTVVGRRPQHRAYVDALLAELVLEGDVLADRLETVFLGGGTPTFTDREELARLLAALPDADELTVEANPETVTPELASLLVDGRVSRVSLGAQSFQPHLLEVLERRAQPDDVRRAVYLLRDAGFDNISLDLLYGIPGQSAADLESDLADALSARARASLVLRARGEAGDEVHTCIWRRARAAGRGHGGLLRGRRRHADRVGISVVRDRQLLRRA